MTESQRPAGASGVTASASPVRIRRPLRVGELLEATIRLYRRRWRIFLVLAAIVQLPAFAATVALLPLIDGPLQRGLAAGGTPSLDDARTLTVAGLALATISHGTSVLLGGLVTAGVAELDRGAQAPVTASVGLWLRRLAALTVAGALSGLVSLALLAACALMLALAVAAGPSGGPVAFLLVLLAVAVLAVLAFLITRWTLVAPAVVFEGHGGRSSLRRSWQLVRGSTWRVLGIGLLVTFAIVVIGRTVVELIGIVLAVLDPVVPGIASGGGVIVSAAVQLALTPLVPLTYAFLFDDLASRPGASTGVPPRPPGPPAPPS